MAEGKAQELLSELKKSKEADPSVISDILKDLIIPDSASDSLKVTLLISCLVYHVHTLPNPRSNDTLINTLQLIEALLSESDIGYRINDLKASTRVLNCLMLVVDNRELAMTEFEKIKSCLQEEEFEPVASIQSLEKLLNELPSNEDSRQVLQQLYLEYINDIFEMVDNVVMRLSQTSEVIIEPPESDVIVHDELSNNQDYDDVVVLSNDQEVTLTDEQSTFTDQEVILTDQQSTLTDQEVILTDQQSTLTDQEVTLTDEQSTLTDQEVTLTDQEVILTDEQSTLTDQEVTLTDQRSTLYTSKTKGKNISVVPLPKKPKLDYKRRVWTKSNVKYLVKGVNQFGEGNWMSILMAYSADLPANTTGVVLKDKWRNLIKYNHIIKERGKWSMR